ncbi:MAG: AMP-binding protein, partial [Pseudomonadota bacterium]
YAPLLHGCTTVIYEGKPVGTPDAGAFWRVIADHRVKALFTAPTAIRAIRREDPEGLCFADYDCTSLQHLFLAGERCDPDSLHWAEALLGVPVIDHWWQTETGWSIAANYPGIEMLKVKPGSSGLPAPGYEIAILDPQGKSVPPGQMGAICIRLPMPPSCLGGLWQAEERFKQSYLDDYPGYYSTGDAGYLDEEGYVYVMARTDDVINVAGHRLSTGAIEEVLAQLPDSAECAVVGSVDPVKGQVPLGFLVLKNGVTRPHDVIIAEAKSLVREQIGAIAALKALCIVQRLPKTRSGKILRATMRAIADDKPWKMPATIDDPAILDEISQCLQASQNAKHR